MSLLVANYGTDSDSDEDNIIDNTETNKQTNRNLLEVLESDDEDENDITNGESTKLIDEDNSKHAPVIGKLPNPMSGKLPNPLAGRLSNPMAGKIFNNKASQKERLDVSSVFQNKYSISNKPNILEQHVKLSKEDEQGGAKKKQMCFKFKKGQCHYGKKCKYSHGDPILVPKTIDKKADEDSMYNDENNAENPLSERLKSLPVTAVTSSETRKPGTKTAATKRVIRDDDGNIIEVKRRPGVTNTLLPSKKSKSALDLARANERPWTK